MKRSNKEIDSTDRQTSYNDVQLVLHQSISEELFQCYKFNICAHFQESFQEITTINSLLLIKLAERFL
jgi:hypothetical protein